MDAPTFIKRVAELGGFDKTVAERVVRATLLNLGTRIDPGEAHDLTAHSRFASAWPRPRSWICGCWFAAP